MAAVTIIDIVITPIKIVWDRHSAGKKLSQLILTEKSFPRHQVTKLQSGNVQVLHKQSIPLMLDQQNTHFQSSAVFYSFVLDLTVNNLEIILYKADLDLGPTVLFGNHIFTCDA